MRLTARAHSYNNTFSQLPALMMESEAFDYLDAPVERVTGADIPTPYAIGLEKMVFPQVEDIVAAVLRTTARGGATVVA